MTQHPCVAHVEFIEHVVRRQIAAQEILHQLGEYCLPRREYIWLKAQ